MDENETAPDLKVGSDGMMSKDDGPIAINVATTQRSEPEVNNLAPPPPSPSDPRKDDSPKEQSSAAADSLDADSGEGEATGQKPPVVAPEDSTASLPAVKEAPTSELHTPPNEHSQPKHEEKSISEAPGKPQPENSIKQDMKKDMKQKKVVPHEHRNNKKMAAFLIVFVALLLCGAAVYVYLSTQDNASETSRSTVTGNADPATGNDVDRVSAEIDEALESLDQSDFSEDALSDETLGL